MDDFQKILPVIGAVGLVFLLKEGFSIYRYVKTCKLHEAAKTGNIGKVRQLLEQGHPVSALDPRFGLTPLHFAVRNGRVDVALLLIENGASLTQPSANGITALDWAAEYLDSKQRDALLSIASGDTDIEGAW